MYLRANVIASPRSLKEYGRSNNYINIIRKQSGKRLNIMGMLLLIILSAISVSSEQNVDDEKRVNAWKRELNRIKIPRSIIKLKYLYSIPNANIAENKNKDVFMKSSDFMDIDKEKNIIYLSDSKLNRVLAFDLNGMNLYSMGSPGNGPGELSRPTHVIVAGNGNVLLVNNVGNGRIEMYSAEGQYINNIKLYKSYVSIKEYSNNIYATPRNPISKNAFLVNVMDFKGDLIRQFGELTKYTDKRNILNEVLLCIENKYIYIGFRNQNILRKYSIDGKILNEIIINQDERMKVNTKYNRKAIKTDASGGYRNVIQAMATDNDSIYLMLSYPYIGIIEMNDVGKKKNIYYAEQKYNGIYNGMIVETRLGKRYFYILEVYPDNCINVYSE